LNLKTVSLLGYIIPYTKFEHLGIIHFFELCCGQTDRQTDKQTDSKILPTPTDIVGVGNNNSLIIIISGRSLWCCHRDKVTARVYPVQPRIARICKGRSNGLPSPPLPSPPSPPLPLPGGPIPPLIRLGGLGERSSSPSGSGRSPAARRFLMNFRLKRTLLVIAVIEEISHQSHHHQAEYLTEIEHLVQQTGQYHMLHNLCFSPCTCKLSLV